jgi:hypothetical protein
MGTGVGLRQAGYHDCAGGGQVVVVDGFAYIAHMRSPHGTSVVDVRDPRNCKEVASISMPPGTHSHKARVANGVMIVNHEMNDADKDPIPSDWKGGFGVYDVSNPAKPREITRWTTHGKGVHRYDFDGRYLYFSPTLEGYVGNIMMIMDLKDPAKPTEVGRWWMPGQWTAGGETPDWHATAHRCHHPLRMGNRLYTSYWLAGFHILDIDDMTKPKRLSGIDWSPPFSCPTHTALPIPFPIGGRRYVLVNDEDVMRKPDETPAFLWMVDITDETRPVPVSSFQVESVRAAHLKGEAVPTMSACHQPCEKVTGTEIPCAWFAQGLRIIDIKDPYCLREVAHFVPDVPQGAQRVSSNDLTVDDRGLIYIIDRIRGLTTVERT